MNRVELNQWLIDRYGFDSYLEIGCHMNESFTPIRCAKKVGVDPANGGTLRMTSDEFFKTSTERFDLVFIDANHHHDFVYRDVINTLVKALTPRGIVTLHDCWPPDGSWEAQNLCGTCWRALAWYRQSLWLDVAVGDFDCGVGVVLQRKNTDPVTLQKSMDEMQFAERTRELMRLLGEDDLKRFVARDD